MKRPEMPTVDQDEGFAIVGLTLLALGLGLVFIPAALVAVGILFITYAFIPHDKPTESTP